MPSFERQKDALAFRNELIAGVELGTYASVRKTHTVAEAVDHWLEVKRGQIRRRTLLGYLVAAKHINGPLLSGTSKRAEHTLTGERREVPSSSA